MLKSIIVVLGLGLGFVGCAQHGDTQAVVGQVQTPEYGKVLRIEPMTVKDDGKGAQLGSTIGAISGGVVGENKWTSLLGTLGGMVVGNVVGAKMNSKAGERITLQMDDGREIATVLAIDKNYKRNYKAGDSVRAYFLNGGIQRIEKR